MMINIHVMLTYTKGGFDLIISVLILFTYIYIDTDITNAKPLSITIAGCVSNCVIYITSSFQLKETFLLSSVFT